MLFAARLAMAIGGGRMDGARHVIKRILNPRSLSSIRSHDVVSKRISSPRSMILIASYDVASTIHQSLAIGAGLAALLTVISLAKASFEVEQCSFTHG